MKISSSFYIRSWLKNSLMAIGTGFVMGYFSSIIIPLPNNTLIGAIVAFIIYQYVSFDRFFGARRGEFEYEYRNDLVEKNINKLVLKSFGISTYIDFILDGFNAICTIQEEICKRLLQNASIKQSAENLFFSYIKMSNLAMKQDDFKKEKQMLVSANELRPNDLIANYRLAVCYEMDGSVDDAIKHYYLASNDPYLNSNQLRKFILSQVERIKLKGPMNRPPALGAKYMVW